MKKRAQERKKTLGEVNALLYFELLYLHHSTNS